MARLSSLSLLGLLYYGNIVAAAASSNYTDYLLSSGTVKLGEWQSAYDKASLLVETLTTEEKLTIVTGGSAGNFTALKMLDSSTNPYTYYYVTTWPAGLAMAMTWNETGIHDQGQALGSEFRGKGINLAYAPTIQPLGRSAWGGRQGETYGPDSYLNGHMGGQFVKGMADAGVIPSAKHFILNEQETNRMGSTSGGGGMGGGAPGSSNSTTTTSTTTTLPYSSVADDKTFHETYLAPFYDAVKSGIGGAMCGMNRINGTYACENQVTLGKYLKAELGFPGIVHPDVGGQHNGIESANAGEDYGSSSYWSNSTLGVGLTNGSFTEARLNDMVIRNIMGFYRYSQDVSYPAYVSPTADVDVRGDHPAAARARGAESIALLKNTNNALPLKSKKSVSIFGYHAAPRYLGPNTALSVYSGTDPTMIGHMTQVGGSAMGSLAYETTPFQVFSNRAASDGFMLRWWLNDSVVTTSSGMVGAGSVLTETTIGVADNSDVCICFLNAWSGEGGDRSELTNADQDNLVNTVADNCNNTIVVINTTGPRLLDQWITHENVTGVLYGGPLGMESGNAIDDVLFGAVNPSGRLIHTIAKNESDYDPGTAISENETINFTEGNYIDYKYFDKYNITPRYEFGYGLSYTSFAYGTNISIQADTAALQEEYATGQIAIGGKEDLWDIVANVTATITNTGSITGADVPQLYVTFPDAADQPIRQLRGFQKVLVAPSATETVTFTLRRRDLSYWDVVAQNWAVAKGQYTFYLAASSRDMKASTTLTL
ncbi:hypothetical protein BP5796_12529 [Coleophoma crateriformis]|uniref:beta-glucosidase n=1 Tax=Coleophoma crateriformis TaxID=565419 RepID=A0A3D8Q7X4_9HELO|nr:hypothetical protein BP5796_12529 [Coleophoma crateriformis]